MARLQNSTFFLNWIASESLDIAGVEPDIEGYCVDVENSSDLMLHSECDINVTEFVFSQPPRSWCDTIVFIVTPVNIVGNGTKIAVPYYHNPGM